MADKRDYYQVLGVPRNADEAEIMRGLLDRGVLVRGGAALGSQTPALRVTYGLPEENERFLAALAEVLAPAVTR